MPTVTPTVMPTPTKGSLAPTVTPDALKKEWVMLVAYNTKGCSDASYAQPAWPEVCIQHRNPSSLQDVGSYRMPCLVNTGAYTKVEFAQNNQSQYCNVQVQCVGGALTSYNASTISTCAPFVMADAFKAMCGSYSLKAGQSQGQVDFSGYASLAYSC